MLITQSIRARNPNLKSNIFDFKYLLKYSIAVSNPTIFWFEPIFRIDTIHRNNKLTHKVRISSYDQFYQSKSLLFLVDARLIFGDTKPLAKIQL